VPRQTAIADVVPRLTAIADAVPRLTAIADVVSRQTVITVPCLARQQSRCLASRSVPRGNRRFRASPDGFGG